MVDLGSSVHDDKVRQRLAEIRAAAGVPHSQISLEVLYFLPRDFIVQYSELFSRAVRADNGEGARAAAQQAQAQVGKAQGGATPPLRRHKRAWFIVDQRALNAKTRIDKRLRRLAVEINEELADLGGTEAKPQLQCKGCRLYLQDAWKYCPQCGKDRDGELIEG